MASHIIVAAAVAVILAVCLIQVNSAPQEASTTTQLPFSDLVQDAKASFNKALENPQVKDILSKAQDLFTNFQGKVQEFTKPEDKPTA